MWQGEEEGAESRKREKEPRMQWENKRGRATASRREEEKAVGETVLPG